MELYSKTATDLAGMLRQKQCSAVEIANSVFDRMDAVEDRVKAYLTVEKESALAQAARVDEKLAAGEELPPLAGIPVAVKDNICTKGVRTTCASKILENFVPPYNATVVERLKEQDFVMTGKVNLDEFAMGGSCENSAFQKTANPHDLARVPGGSSGGSAAAVAAGEAILSLGSDTGGSIRQPSSFCGLVGLKPTYGAVSRYGLVAFASSLDQIGPLGRSVEDVAMLYRAICGRDPMDATSAALPQAAASWDLEGGVRGLRIGLPWEYFGEGVEEPVKAAVYRAVEELKKAGAEVKEISLGSADYAVSAYYIISSAEASSNLARFDGVKYGYRAPNCEGLTELYERTRSEGFGAEVKRRIMLGTFVLSSGYYDAYYKRAKRLRQRIMGEYEDAFADCDVVITPTAPSTAYKLGERVGDILKMYAGDICTVTVNIAGLPALSVPCGKDENNLPIGMQLIGPKFSEGRLFQTAHTWEKLCGGFNAIPTL
ncbi:Asp-tRNA(Asn)/Glu-tRNA(Gln) amidotransferase subunit GatA [Clostridiaceae bacterium NSJ-31]|uniref:Glutamyl-tRNA(Gln) amidotransferase subunit A n=1 Tax=Ligaoa zhengdingensis TaxID=2763658 RepID=A0A926DVJ0_9FIRM|nr:Asp-tRNA(Asn)/Glu-tRNA(Gln) amidotransferase subunit GatA [Ligaoa zhengdingensis]MBC8545491.1 Asp-tRNA(Asn)/Glu-tRNA(Gln) amidotransferase subunit GatA [Ligaoa zhengdingensis]